MTTTVGLSATRCSVLSRSNRSADAPVLPSASPMQPSCSMREPITLEPSSLTLDQGIASRITAEAAERWVSDQDSAVRSIRVLRSLRLAQLGLNRRLDVRRPLLFYRGRIDT